MIEGYLHGLVNLHGCMKVGELACMWDNRETLFHCLHLRWSKKMRSVLQVVTYMTVCATTIELFYVTSITWKMPKQPYIRVQNVRWSRRCSCSKRSGHDEDNRIHAAIRGRSDHQNNPCNLCKRKKVSFWKLFQEKVSLIRTWLNTVCEWKHNLAWPAVYSSRSWEGQTRRKTAILIKV